MKKLSGRKIHADRAQELTSTPSASSASTEDPKFPLAVLMRRLDDLEVTLTAEGDQLLYRAPRGALSASDKQELTSRRKEVIRYVRALTAAKKPPLQPYQRSPTPSFTQRLWWKGVQAVGSRHSDCLRLLAPFSGASERTAEAAIRRVIARHDALRYRSADTCGTLVAAINNAEDFSIDTALISAKSTDLQAAFRPSIAQFALTTIPIERPWLTVAKLMMMGEHEGVIALGLNHIIADGTSLLIIKNELETSLAYGAHVGAERPSSQYAAWESTWFRGEVACSLAAYSAVLGTGQ